MQYTHTQLLATASSCLINAGVQNMTAACVHFDNTQHCVLLTMVCKLLHVLHSMTECCLCRDGSISQKQTLALV